MDLVFHQVDELHQVDVAHRYGLVEEFPGPSVVEGLLAVDRRRDLTLLLDLLRTLLQPLKGRVTHLAHTHGLEPQLQTGSLRSALFVLV